MENLEKPPTPRKERKIPHLTLYFPVTAKIGTIAIYRLDGAGLRLVRRLPGVKLEPS